MKCLSRARLNIYYILRKGYLRCGDVDSVQVVSELMLISLAWKLSSIDKAELMSQDHDDNLNHWGQKTTFLVLHAC